VFHEAEEAGAGALPGSIVAEALAHGEHHAFELIGVGGTLLLLGAVTGILGVGLAYRWYVRRPQSAARFVERLPFGIGPGMYRASVNRYYVDDLYELVWARGGVLVSNALWWFDARVIDGAVNGAGSLARWVGGGVRRTQTGRVQNYGLGIAAGLAIVVLAYATVVR
jgi:NADH:ubiquinone oxidoreductase subunit 5 (subunit L)/multisubunit Na+/H+ antiporter MnhA subunit